MMTDHILRRFPKIFIGSVIGFAVLAVLGAILFVAIAAMITYPGASAAFVTGALASPIFYRLGRRYGPRWRNNVFPGHSFNHA